MAKRFSLLDPHVPNRSTGRRLQLSYRTDEKQGGNGAFEASIRTDCDQDGGKGLQGIYGEYFDNDGVSFSSSACLPSSTEAPTESKLNPTSTEVRPTTPTLALTIVSRAIGSPFRLIDVHETGNWTFFISSDDGWSFGSTANLSATNYGMHGMRERSGSIN